MLVFLVILLIWTISSISPSWGHMQEHHQQHQTIEQHLRPDEPQLPVGHEHFDEFGGHDVDFDRELVMGSEFEAEQFKELEPEQAKERLGLLFDKMDQNSDGYLTRDELKSWIKQSLLNLDVEASRTKIKSHDTNQDGVVTWPEYMHAVYGYTLTEIDSLRKDQSSEVMAFIQTIEQEKVKFETADLDKDGKLNITEYASFEHPHNYQHMAPYELMHTLRDFDKNKDGLIDIQEYLGDEKMDEHTIKLERENFKRYDTNNDGMLDHQEMIHWVTPGFDKTAHDETEHLFNETDKDKNNQLTKEEVTEHHEFWVGSQATDYGRRLEDEL